MPLLRNTNVIKHSAAIQITNEVSAIQRRAWNVLLGKAYSNLPTLDKHQIAISELIDILGFDSKNEAYLKETLKALVKTTVEWNILGKDKESDWGVSSLLADIRIRKGICYYSYGTFLKEMLYNPKMYAKISLSMQNRFKSKHALALYELFVDYIDVNRGKGETPFIDVEKFRKMMGVKEDQYAEFKTLNKWVVTYPLREINEKSNLTATVSFKRENRRVVALKFFVVQKEGVPLLSPHLEDVLDDTDVSNPLVQELQQRKMTKRTAESVIAKFAVEKITEKIEYHDWLIEQAKEGKIPQSKAPQSGKWLHDCIQEDWQPPSGFQTAAERKKSVEWAQIFKSAQTLFEQGRYSEAIAKAEKCQQKDATEEVSTFLTEARNRQRQAEEEREMEAYLAGLSPEEQDVLHQITRKKLQESPVGRSAIGQGLKSPIYESIYISVVREGMRPSLKKAK
jgi:plasmid replication initiation protein